mmetsp:Transcript_28373/g.90295  ORF Transcript_28373/g.90295 Transcript_28373/m.90295 type:complete len:157 (+) Transcript_28373:283-753(+)
MTPRDVRALLRHERAAMRSEQASGARELGPLLAAEAPAAGGREDGKLVLDPCLGRWDLLRAKASLSCVLLSGIALAVLVAHVGHRWLRRCLALGSVPPVEATLVMGVGFPAILAAFLCVLEHSEWMYLRRVSPQSQLPYTPLLHELLPRLRRAFTR